MKRLLAVGLVGLVALGCGDGISEVGDVQAAIHHQDGDDTSPLENVVFIRRVGTHPTADPTFPNGTDYDNRNDYDAHHCGGVLVADDWVLTAAHCLYYGFPMIFGSASYLFRLDQFEVVFGKRRLLGLDANAQRRAPILVQFHPSSFPYGIGSEVEQTDWFGMDWQCEFPAGFGFPGLDQWNYDVALIKLGHPFEGAKPVKVAKTTNPPPVAIAVGNDVPGPISGGGGGKSQGGDRTGTTGGGMTDGGPTTEGRAVHPQYSGKFRGWGRTSNYTYIPFVDDYWWLDVHRSDPLRYYWGKPVSVADCDPNVQWVLNDSKICVRANNGLGTLSLGDSGGPFIINTKLVGIAHAGVQNRDNATGYSAYTSGPKIRSWVNQVISGPGTQYAPGGCPSAGTATTDDCRLTGCPDGFHCHDCPDFQCLPDNLWCY